MTMAAIEVRNATVIRGGEKVVDSVSFNVLAGSWFGIIGANGSGKTSLLRALTGRIPGAIESCKVFGAELSDRPELRSERIGFMPPAEVLPGGLTCREVLSLLQPDEEQWRSAITPLWSALGLKALLERRVGDCSAGMKQRIAIASAFARGDRLVVLDEPFNWLDPVAIVDLRYALRQSVDDGVTLITALHDMLTLASCDVGILLGNGVVVASLEEADVSEGRRDPFKFEMGIIDVLRQHSQFG